MKRTIKAVSAVIACVGAVALLNSCEKKGPAEKAGERMDNAVEDTGDKIEDATDN